MATNAQVVFAVNEIKSALTVALNPLSTQNERSFAYQVIENFKQSSSICPDVGFHLFNEEKEPELRKCGLQFVESFIKLRWDSLDSDKKTLYKHQAIKLIQVAQFSEPVYIKESVVKVILEVIKRSWPQEWGSLFQDLSQLQSLGNVQLELVLIVLMRLSEDIDGLDENLTASRKNEMRTTLSDNMKDLFDFFIDTLQKQVMNLKESTTKEAIRIAEAAVYTITSFAAWVNLTHLLAKDKILFQVLFWLLEVEQLKIHASNCLCVVFSRKFNPDKKKELMIILSKDVLNIVQSVARSCLDAAKINEEQYQFLKTVVEMMCDFGKIQLSPLWGDDRGFKERPESFDQYLRLMVDFSRHDSMVIGMMTSKLWSCFLSHKFINKDTSFLNVLPEILECLHVKLAKIGSPFLSDQPASLYSVMDFDDLDEYNDNFSEVRNFTLSTIKKITELLPNLVLEHCLSRLNEAAQLPHPNVKDWSEKQILLSLHYIKWDALAHYAKNGFSSSYFKQEQKNISADVVKKCDEVLRRLVEYKCDVSAFLSLIINCMEALFPVFRFSQDNLLGTMQRLIRLIGLDIEHDQTVNQQIRLKRHSCGAFSKLCKEIPHILATIFNDLEIYFSEEFQKDRLSNNEKGVLLEGLLVVCMHVQDTVRKSNFISRMFCYIHSVFSRIDIKESLADILKYVNFLGLNVNEITDEIQSRRNELLLALYMCQAASRSLNIDSTETESDPNKYPWVQHMIDVLPKILDLARQHSMLWTVQDKFAANHKDVLLQSASETQQSTGKSTEDADAKPNHAQNSIIHIHETIYTTLSHYGHCVGPTLYSLSGLSDVMIEKLVNNWKYLPNFKLRKVCKSLKSFVLTCPPKYYESMVGPLLSAAINQLFQKLCQEWKQIKDSVGIKKSRKREGNEEEGENEETVEIIEERNLHNFSREFIDVLASLCQYNAERDQSGSVTDGTIPVIGVLGKFLLSYEGTNLALVMTFFTALTWPDTSTVNRMYNLVVAIIKTVFVRSNPVNAEIPNQLLLLVLQGLQVHGSDSSGQVVLTNIAMQFYVNLREQYPDLVKVMLMIPSCTEQDLQTFDLDMFANLEQLNDIQRRKRFKKLIEAAFSKTVSELYKDNKKIRDLPPLAPRIKQKRSLLDADDSTTSLCNLFGDET